MKIEVDLPERVEGRHIYILAGTELIACSKPVIFDGEWDEIIVKTTPCQRCGECCKSMHPNDALADLGYYNPETGWCRFLRMDGDKYDCAIQSYKPLSCALGEMTHPKCKVKYGGDT